MMAIEFPVQLLWALRWLLFLGPLAAVVFLVTRNHPSNRTIVGCLFAFLYGLGLIFATHVLAIHVGWWHYGGSSLMLNGVPADILIGGATLFGPVLYLAFPSVAPIWLLLPIVLLLHGIFFSSLQPLVFAGSNWFFGVILVFAVAHLPAIYLARWTARNEHLACRTALLAIGYGFLAFVVLPALIVHAMHERIDLQARSCWLVGICVTLVGVFFVMGLSAVQLFVVHGKGTPVPLDPTERLVRVGLFSYLINPMQLCSAATWVLIGIALGSVWVASSALMAWVFVAGMVRWHHRYDLLERFPTGWPEYRSNVPEWLPRWRPWIPYPSRLFYDPNRRNHRRLVHWLKTQNCVGLEIVAVENSDLNYVEESDGLSFVGTSAATKAINHINFAWAVLASAVLLISLPCQTFVGRAKITELRVPKSEDIS
jgi:protein-S-isoprenylcysteine O-methyltransferase Ste14